MRLSVASNFEPGLAARLAVFPEVREVHGGSSLNRGGAGPAGCECPSADDGDLRRAVWEAHEHGLFFCYTLDSAAGNGERSQSRERSLRHLLDTIVDIGVDGVSVTSLSLMDLVKSGYPELSVRAGAGAGVDTAHQARRWAERGADSIYVSAAVCNRDTGRLAAIRAAVTCDLQLRVDAACPPSFMVAPHSPAMADGGQAAGQDSERECPDHRFRRCLGERLRHPVNYLRAVWIRPEDLSFHEKIGYTHFRIGVRGCPTGWLLRRVGAYASRRFDGNLLEIVGPVAQMPHVPATSQLLGLPIARALRHLTASSTVGETGSTERYDLDFEHASVYIDNAGLRGFLKGMPFHNCARGWCRRCGYCHRWAAESVEMEDTCREYALAHAAQPGCGPAARMPDTELSTASR